MYKTYWGMTVNPFSKELKVSDAFHSQDYLKGKKRYEYLKNVKGIGLFTACQEQEKHSARGVLWTA